MKRAVFTFLAGLWCVLTATAGQPATHTVKKGETLYSISKSYGLKVNDLVKANPILKSDMSIKPGQRLAIPGSSHLPASSRPLKPSTEGPAQASALKKKPLPVPSTPEIPYRDEDNRKTEPSQTKTATASANNDNPVLEKPRETPVNEESFSIKTSSSNPADYAALFNQYEQHGYKLSHNRGEANYIDDKTSGNPYLALCSSAETGSVIKVTNLMNQRSIYVKVVGHVSSSDASREIILKLSQQAAGELGTYDEKFLVEVTGVESNQASR